MGLSLGDSDQIGEGIAAPGRPEDIPYIVDSVRLFPEYVNKQEHQGNVDHTHQRKGTVRRGSLRIQSHPQKHQNNKQQGKEIQIQVLHFLRPENQHAHIQNQGSHGGHGIKRMMFLIFQGCKQFKNTDSAEKEQGRQQHRPSEIQQHS